jgi:hypothetical protein
MISSKARQKATASSEKRMLTSVENWQRMPPAERPVLPEPSELRSSSTVPRPAPRRPRW